MAAGALFLTAAAAVAQSQLSISILGTERVADRFTYVLFAVENKSDQRFEATRWSCVFVSGSRPVFEQESIIENVVPRGRTVSRIVQGYGGPFDRIDCRLMSTRPASCPC